MTKIRSNNTETSGKAPKSHLLFFCSIQVSTKNVAIAPARFTASCACRGAARTGLPPLPCASPILLRSVLRKSSPQAGEPSNDRVKPQDGRRADRFCRNADGRRALRGPVECHAGGGGVQIGSADRSAHIRADPRSRSLHPQRHEGLRPARRRRRHRHRRPSRLCQGLRRAQQSGGAPVDPRTVFQIG